MHFKTFQYISFDKIIDFPTWIFVFEPPLDETNKMACVPSKDSDQPGHPSSLIKVFAVSMKKPWVLSYPLSASEDYDQTGRMLGAHVSMWFCHEAAHFSSQGVLRSFTYCQISFVSCLLMLCNVSVMLCLVQFMLYVVQFMLHLVSVYVVSVYVVSCFSLCYMLFQFMLHLVSVYVICCFSLLYLVSVYVISCFSLYLVSIYVICCFSLCYILFQVMLYLISVHM